MPKFNRIGLKIVTKVLSYDSYLKKRLNSALKNTYLKGFEIK